MNVFFRDSKEFLSNSAKIINEQMSYDQILFATLSFALGIERILKGILYEFNPSFVLIKPNFSNALQVFYKNRIVADCVTNGILDSTLNEDVITFRNSLLRASVCSKVVNDNKNMLFYISECRDIIAHHDIQKLDFKRLDKLLLADFYPLVSAFCHEQSLSKKKILSNLDIKLSKISSQHQSNVEDAINLKIEASVERWGMQKNVTGYIEDKNKVTTEILKTKFKFPVECPACKNQAVIYTSPEYAFDPYSQKKVVVGAKINRLKCQYCKLVVKDYKELDFLKLSENIPKQEFLEQDENGT